jgi:hypothetical protein
MDESAYRSVAEAVRLVAVVARGEAGLLDAHRSALARNALVWWHGVAAERYQRLVQDRANAFADLSGYLDGLAGRADALASELEQVADVEAAVAAVGAAHPVLPR